MVGYYDRQGNSMDLMEWAELIHAKENKRVAETTVGDYWVSTVWLGLDHNMSGIGPPLIFETMAFDGDGDPDDRFMARYATEEQAARGHEQIVNMIRELYGQ